MTALVTLLFIQFLSSENHASTKFVDFFLSTEGLSVPLVQEGEFSQTINYLKTLLGAAGKCNDTSKHFIDVIIFLQNEYFYF